MRNQLIGLYIIIKCISGCIEFTTMIRCGMGSRNGRCLQADHWRHRGSSSATGKREHGSKT
jgi:hypothetical protein